jgi:transketolase
MNLHNHPAKKPDLAALRAHATNMRRHMLTMAGGPGQGYIGQGLGIADALCALYFH